MPRGRKRPHPGNPAAIASNVEISQDPPSTAPTPTPWNRTQSIKNSQPKDQDLEASTELRMVIGPGVQRSARTRPGLGRVRAKLFIEFFTYARPETTRLKVGSTRAARRAGPSGPDQAPGPLRAELIPRSKECRPVPVWRYPAPVGGYRRHPPRTRQALPDAVPCAHFLEKSGAVPGYRPKVPPAPRR
ncbi:uncharacterized protein PGTG_05424 [Puccinia graminis f. sp. tritici CRL 75-36-700-3]|uniref:Uncharacterized protein n=1 Tax=Puccinia graminis f. sp. tritici (strain CRL 75-36-700-3 / race SCCL) TaxID=418459 RepID=E3K493_PUCGT|nr:uncharacterized protein PGTG_05424 [Puccinia graminis f. sp. tritici CRL 75-36-700-3]EFP79103.2 hypothetical protein PGTG_05424 [Puccinia graminis f. sp. tritici CRL 75-36-700-3]